MAMGFKSVFGKFDGMRKAVDWTVYPGCLQDGKTAKIQSDKRMASINLETMTAWVSNGKDSTNNFMGTNAFCGGKQVPVPEDIAKQLREIGPLGNKAVISLSQGTVLEYVN